MRKITGEPSRRQFVNDCLPRSFISATSIGSGLLKGVDNLGENQMVSVCVWVCVCVFVYVCVCVCMCVCVQRRMGGNEFGGSTPNLCHDNILVSQLTMIFCLYMYREQ